MTNVNNINSDSILSMAQIKEHILPHYKLSDGEVTMVKFKDTDKQRAVFKISYKETSFCLKKMYYDESNLLFVYSAMEWLYRNCIKVPKLLPTINNNRFITYNSMIFILTPWVNGDKCNFDNMDHLILTSETLGKIHKLSKNFIPIEGSAKRIGLEDYHSSISKHFNQILQSANYASNYKDKFSNIFTNNLEYNLELAKLSLEISSSINNQDLTRSLCHGDYVNKNIIIDHNDVWLIDFDKCKYDFSAHDIAYFLRRLLKRENTNWQINTTIKILNSYMKYNKLTESDLKYILAYISFPQKYWKISRDYYKNIKKCNKNAFITLLEKGLDRTSHQLDYVQNMILVLQKYYGVKF